MKYIGTIFSLQNYIEYIPIVKGDFQGTFLTIIFGLTAGILGLVGLLAIFISLNSQHNIQKARELYWQLKNFHFEDYLDKVRNLNKRSKFSNEDQNTSNTAIDMLDDIDERKNLSNQFTSNFSLYDLTFHNKTNKFTSSIIKLTTQIILLVVFIWFFSILFIFDFKSFQISYLIILLTFTTIAFFMIRFISVLKKLSTTDAVVEDLPKPENFVKLKKDTFNSTVNLLAILAYSADIRVNKAPYRNNTITAQKVEFELLLKVPFNCFHATIEVRSQSNRNTSERYSKRTTCFIESARNFKKVILENQTYYSYILEAGKIPIEYTELSVNIQIDDATKKYNLVFEPYSLTIHEAIEHHSLNKLSCVAIYGPTSSTISYQLDR
ncbi:hypothetical protein OCD85_01220 [Bacillus pacificus]|uniref:hypothetical protein n=1 Tax=Bacillus TaxID=1386 RepID=UPI0009424785|nr:MULTISPECIES: hypothetical protein [Bacillus]MBD0728240.1 hypothetical protein [Bacillus cereus]MCC2484883.1 hypothetical protein [Bacillus pacificus]MCU4738969.1 hypothetical protein [Bacillus paranthracis]MCU4869115.1 hypothetical protein [Bacillus paranthracis]MCU5075037.1 hypothetical protein [Bacillus paranthracis]